MNNYANTEGYKVSIKGYLEWWKENVVMEVGLVLTLTRTSCLSYYSHTVFRSS